MSFPAKIAGFVRKQGMVRPGDRVGVAVSGGADSVALLRALMELRGELGSVLAVVHFNHKIRAEAGSDGEFVRALAEKFGLECFAGEGDAKKVARERRVSLETAARELRYQFFSQLGLDKIATAHTLDDQAETVLMKFVRGAGTKGMSGIWPVRQYSVPITHDREKQVPRSARDDNQNQTQGSSTRSLSARSLRMTDVENYGANGQRMHAGKDALVHTFSVIRPLLGVRRREVEKYLRSLGQDWREDATNRDVKHTRNKVRHELLPLLEREYNPNIYQQLADAAEVARGEEEFWQEYSVLSTQYPENADPSTRSSAAADSLSLGMTSEKTRRREAGSRRQENPGPSTSATSAAFARDDNFSSTSLPLDVLLSQPLAVRRRVVRQAFEDASGKSLDFAHTDELVRFLERRESSRLQLPEYWFAVLDWPRRRVTFEERTPAKNGTPKVRITSKSKRKDAHKKAGPSLRSG